MFINVGLEYYNLDNIKGFSILDDLKLKLYFIDGTCKTTDKLSQAYIDDLINLVLGDDYEEYEAD